MHGILSQLELLWLYSSYYPVQVYHGAYDSTQRFRLHRGVYNIFVEAC